MVNSIESQAVLTLPQTEEQWLECLPLPEYLAMIPAGKIQPIVGPIIYIDGNGTQMSKQEYIDHHGVDPELGWSAVKAYRLAAGKKDVIKVL